MTNRQGPSCPEVGAASVRGWFTSIRVRWMDHIIVRNTLWMMVSHGLRIIIQAAYFVLIARALGADGYGGFLGAVALVSVLAPFAGLGSGNLLVKSVARDRTTFPVCWGNALAVTIVSGLLLSAVAVAITPFVLPPTIGRPLVVMVALSDLLFVRLLDISGMAFQALERLNHTAQLQVFGSACRLMGALSLLAFNASPTSQTWSFFYFGGSAVCGLVGVWRVCRLIGSPRLVSRHILRDWVEGFYFSVSLSSQNIYNDIDKTMLARLATLGATGIYGAAYRLIDVAFTPVRSLLWASYARFFQHGRTGLSGSLRFAKKPFTMAVGYGVGVGLLMWLAAPLIPAVLGVDYVQTSEATRWLAPVLVLKVIHSFAADCLTGAGYQGRRSGVQAVVAVFNVGVNFWLIPAFSWRGAAWASLLSDGLLAVTLWSMILAMTRDKTTSSGRGRGGAA